MTFIAKVIKHSTTWKAWQQRRATEGKIANVPFHLVAGDNYETGELTRDQVIKLKGVVGVHLVAFGKASAPVVPDAPAMAAQPAPVNGIEVPPEWRTPAAKPQAGPGLANATVAKQQEEQRRKPGRPRLNMN